MARSPLLLIFCLAFALLCLPAASQAGDEDKKEETKKAEPKAPEDTAAPKELESPALSIGSNEEPSPDYQEIRPQNAPAPSVKRPVYRERDLDENIDYSRLVETVEAADPPQGVLPPAMGFRGYRPNMIAIGAGDRTPGFGAMVEYSWNRVGAGVFFSYLNTKGEDKVVQSYGFGGVYGLYRWLPFDISPYFLLGVEMGSKTEETLGGLLGLGIEARIYSGWTALFGWTHHSTVQRGYIGGALGWSF